MQESSQPKYPNHLRDVLSNLTDVPDDLAIQDGMVGKPLSGYMGEFMC
jgi:hypothetical protein